MEGSDPGFDAAVATYAARLACQPLADRTKQEYERWVRSFTVWAKDAPEAVPALERWDKPAAVLWATDDRFLPVRWGARLAATIPTAEDQPTPARRRGSLLAGGSSADRIA